MFDSTRSGYGVTVTTWEKRRHEEGGDGGADVPYSTLADRVSADVIDHYSTSFTLATRLLSAPVRRDIRNLYAVVRIADEIVDGAASDAGEDTDAIRTILDDYAEAVIHAPDAGFHTDPVLHAWSGTVSRCGVDPGHMRSFFASMRSDIHPVAHDEASLAEYIHGSAEVIGLMCLDIFLAHEEQPPADREWLAQGASALGAAFQKVNFLRDLADDHTLLGRAYVPELQDGPLTAQVRDRLLDEVDAGIAAGRERIPALPKGCRPGVAAAAALYAELSARLRRTTPDQLLRTRIRVPAPRKVLVTARAVAQVAAGGPR